MLPEVATQVSQRVRELVQAQTTHFIRASPGLKPVSRRSLLTSSKISVWMDLRDWPSMVDKLTRRSSCKVPQETMREWFWRVRLEENAMIRHGCTNRGLVGTNVKDNEQQHQQHRFGCFNAHVKQQFWIACYIKRLVSYTNCSSSGSSSC